MGGAVAIEAMASREAPKVDRVVLLSPAVWGWSTQPLDYKLALWIAAHTVPGLVLTPPDFVTSKVAASDNLEELRHMGRDPNLIFGARPDALYGLVGLMERAWRDTGKLKAPTLYAYGAHDQVIPRNAAFEAAARLPKHHRTAYYADSCHLMLIDLEGQTVWDDVLGFLRDPKAPLPSAAPPIPGPGSAEAKEKTPRCLPRRAAVSAPAP
jgi:alpha-beta hydrolase superfamily lysophospholipase